MITDSEIFDMPRQNMTTKQYHILFDEIAMGTGFMTGVYYAIGIDPNDILFKTLMQLTITTNPNADLTPFILLAIVPTILTIFSLIAAYALGKWLGLLSVFIALFSGLPIIPIQC